MNNKILSILKLDKASKDNRAAERTAKALVREQDALINELSAKVDELEVKKEGLESIDLEVDIKKWVADYQKIDIEIEIAKKHLEIAQRTKKVFFDELTESASA